MLSDLANAQTVIVEQDPWYEDFQGRDNMTTADTNLNLIDPITPSARDATTASTVPVGEPERGQG